MQEYIILIREPEWDSSAATEAEWAAAMQEHGAFMQAVAAAGAQLLGGDALERAALGTLGELLGTVESTERIVAAAMALRATRIDQLRLWSEAMAAFEGGAGAGVERDSGPGGEPHGWTAAVRGRRELVFELACALRIPEGTADRLFDESRRLVQLLPATHTALREGEISYRHAQAMCEQTATLPDDACAAFEEALLPFAKTLTVATFTRAARKKRESLHPESIEQRHIAAVDDRRVWVDPQPDGMAFLGAHLSAEIALAAYGRLTDIAAGQNAPDDHRTLAQKRADVFGDLLIDGDTCAGGPAGGDAEVLSGAGSDAASGTGAASSTGHGSGSEAASGTGHGIRAKVLVTVPVLTLLGASDRPADLEGYGPIDPETARRLTADAPSFTRVLTDPVTSAILDFDRTKYVVPADLRLVLRVRDETCRAPGCNRLAVHSDVDHSIDWASGGTTCMGNLAHLCEPHHNVKHHTRVTLRNLRDGRLEWTTPAGRVYVTYPANTVGLPQPGGAPAGSREGPGDAFGPSPF